MDPLMGASMQRGVLEAVKPHLSQVCLRRKASALLSTSCLCVCVCVCVCGCVCGGLSERVGPVTVGHLSNRLISQCMPVQILCECVCVSVCVCVCVCM